MTTPSSHHSSGQGSIRISRTGSTARDLYRRYAVLVDGRTVASLKRGDEVRIPVSAGQHLVQLSIDWQHSPAMRVEVAPDQEVSLIARPRGSAFQLWQAFIRSERYIRLEPVGNRPR